MLLRGGVGGQFPWNLNWSYYFPKSIWHPVRIVALTEPGGGIYSSSSGTLSTARCCKTIPKRVRSQFDPDKFFAVPEYFHGYILIRKQILIRRVIIFLSFSRVKKVESLVFLEFGFHAHQKRLNGGFILSAYDCLEVSETKKKLIGTINLVLLFCPKRQHSRPSQGR